WRGDDHGVDVGVGYRFLPLANDFDVRVLARVLRATDVRRVQVRDHPHLNVRHELDLAKQLEAACAYTDTGDTDRAVWVRLRQNGWGARDSRERGRRFQEIATEDVPTVVHHLHLPFSDISESDPIILNSHARSHASRSPSEGPTLRWAQEVI